MKKGNQDSRKVALSVLLVVVLTFGVVQPAKSQQIADPLPSWNDGSAKKAIKDFVARVTQEGGKDFVPVAERIATFDNDGTLWSEQPIYFQFAFALDRVKALAPQHPEWRTRQPFSAVIAGNMKTLAASGEKGLGVLVMATGREERQGYETKTGAIL
jgi:hypothetical protein